MAMRNQIGKWLVLLVTVWQPLACDGRDPLGDQRTTAPASASQGMMNGGTGAVSTATLQEEVMSRWNATVDAGAWTIDFHWSQWNNFPHPTFKGGTAEAYGQFAEVLLAFFQRGDDFDFLAQNHLFTVEIRADTLSDQGDVVTSFEQLADTFSSSTAFGDITPDVSSALAQIAQRIRQTS
jgi:hypothetical protein